MKNIIDIDSILNRYKVAYKNANKKAIFNIWYENKYVYLRTTEDTIANKYKLKDIEKMAETLENRAIENGKQIEPNYTLNFYDALKEMMENKACVKGNNFVDGLYMKINEKGILVTIDAGRLYIEEPFPFIKSLHYQKFRLLTVMTMKELSK